MKVEKIFRAEDWWVGKASLLIGIVYLLSIFFSISFQSFWWWAFLSLVTIVGFASFGYLVNDFFDQEKDRLVGKRNFLIGKSVLQRVSYFLIAAFFLFIPWFFLPHDFISFLLIAFQLLAYLLYSESFIRLKEKGVSGIVLDALYAHALPAILAAYTYSLIAKKTTPVLFLVLLFCWQFFVGIRNILLHQLRDSESDKLSGTNTLVVQKNRFDTNSKILSLKIIELTILFFLLVLLAMRNHLFLISIIAFAFAVVSYLQMNRENGFKKHFPNIMYEQWLPYSFIFILAIKDIRFLFLLPLHAILFSGVFIEYFYKKIPFKYYSDTFFNHIIYSARHAFNLFKLFVNWIIYLSFKIVRVDLKKEKTNAFGYISKKLNKQK